MLMPKKTKYRKSHKAKRGGVATRGTTISFGSYGLKATTACWVTARQIEAARRVITRYVQRTGKLWIRIFPDRPVTAKGGEIPMGKGKGAVDHYIVPVKPGVIMFEIEGIDEKRAREAMNLAAYKLPVKCQFVGRDQLN
ncbi:MAG TPA: 50S ribosomal protein L16 [bacterium]|jgi:large subunit ribosomal protein L16|nr:50S ribosomal protein L16 [bacterium]HNZ51254.1 50S ribosomal protein L16 [bacterium]HOF79737.1 50S ribosomal protein L16 [bacterium]HOH85149.1 50S ribosomal protein L16 [bacterium]HOQ91565.1 50S ribosomal protein L16 [bacterium]